MAARGSLLLLFVVACRSAPPELESCSGPLYGVWAAPDGAQYHLVQKNGHDLKIIPTGFLPAVLAFKNPRRGFALVPMWDTTAERKPVLADHTLPAPVRSPLWYELRRKDDELVGEGRFRLTRWGRTCQIRFPARLHSCRGRKATLSTRPAPPACEAPPAADWVEVPLVRL